MTDRAVRNCPAGLRIPLPRRGFRTGDSDGVPVPGAVRLLGPRARCSDGTLGRSVRE